MIDVQTAPAQPSHNNHHAFFGIRARLILLVLAAVVPLLLLIAFRAKQQITLERADVLEHIQVRARLIAARLDDQLSNIDTLLLGLSHVVTSDPASIDKNKARLDTIAQVLSSTHSNLKVRALDGRLLGSSGKNLETDFFDRKLFDATIAGRSLVIGDPVFTPTNGNGEWSLTLGRPFYDSAGHVAGMVEVSLDLVLMGTLLEDRALPDRSLISVIDGNRKILMRSVDAEKRIGQTCYENASILQALAIHEGNLEFTSADGDKHLAGFSTCSRAPWLVFARVPSATTFASIERQFRNAQMLGLATLAATLALAWFMASRMTRPIRLLAADAAAVGEGQKIRFSAVESRGEMGTLSETFNLMLSQLEERDTALRRSEEQFRTLIEEAADGVLIADSQGVYTATNSSAARMLGRTQEEIVGRSIIDLIIEADRPQVAPEMARLLAGETVVSEWWFLRKDGTTFPGEFSAKRLSDGRIIDTLRDTTERHREASARARFDRKLQETQKLESLGVMAGSIAHDFNNLLTGILGNASIAQTDLPSDSPAQQNLDSIKLGSMRAADLCKQMLAYSGRGRFVVQTVSLNRLVEETTHLLQISISKNAVLRFNLYPELPSLEADSTQIRQVIMNLVINASEAIGNKSGVISINTGLTRVDRAYLGGTLLAPELPEGTYVHLEISDNGCGMTPEMQTKIFEPFFTTKFTGRGLGLAAVLGIVRGHKGAIKIYSEPGKGTTFKLLFPCTVGNAENTAAANATEKAWRGEGCILVVDDDESIRSTAALMLRRQGFEVALAADGREAVEAFRATPDRFRMVLMDLTMPHLDGEQAFIELRRIRADVRVVLMSGFDRHEAVSRFTGKGLASFLQKPFELQELYRIVQGVLTGTPSLK